jgi:RNA polymerase sigma factor (TIGR02999 family)
LILGMGEDAITALLKRWSNGDSAAFDRLVTLLYGELKSLGDCLLKDRAAGTLQCTALVHEVFLKFRRQECVTWNDRGHFMSFVARMMRQILVDHARGQLTRKRWGGQERVPLAMALDQPAQDDRDLVAVHEALDRLADLDPVRARLVELRYFGGLTLEEIADMDGLSLSTVKRNWTAAKLWLFTELQPVAE